MRNEKGQFLKGTKSTKEENEKRVNALREAWKKSPYYLGDLKQSPLYTAWRSFKFTEKGKKIGFSKEWDNFRNFYADMQEGYEKGYRLGRLDKARPFEKENCMWMSNEELANTKTDTNTITHQGKTRTLKEWSLVLGIPMNALKQRFHKGRNYTSEHMLFGKRYGNRKEIKDIKTLSLQNQKSKVSKMIASYRCSDKKHNRDCDLTREWFFENIVSRPCTYCGTLENIGCDRIDNSIGHTMKNCIPACYLCNSTRRNIFTTEEMMEIGGFIRNILNKRTSP